MAKDLSAIVLEALDVEDPNVLRAACIMSGQMKLQEAERGLIKALNHKAWQIQAEAARALGRLGSQGAGPYLKRMLKASEADLRQKILAGAAGAVEVMGEGNEKVHPELVKAIAIALNTINPKIAQDALLAALSSDQPPLWEAAMAGLATLQSDQGHQRIVELLANSDPKVKKAAATAAGRLRIKEALPGLLRLLTDDDANLRKEAVIALNHVKEKQAIRPLSRMLEDSDAEVRRVAAIALGNTRAKDPELWDELVKALNDRSPEVRKAAVSALGNMKAVTALEAVAFLLKDSHEDVAKTAATIVSALNALRERPDYDI